MFIRQTPLPQVNSMGGTTQGGPTADTMKSSIGKSNLNKNAGTVIGPYIPPDLRELAPHIPKYNLKSFYNSNTIVHNFN